MKQPYEELVDQIIAGFERLAAATTEEGAEVVWFGPVKAAQLRKRRAAASQRKADQLARIRHFSTTRKNPPALSPGGYR